MATTTRNKVVALTKLFLGKRAFSGGKPTKSFWAVSAHFKKQDPTVIRLLTDYLVAIKPNTEQMSITQLFYAARKWASESRVTKVTETKTVNYLSLILEGQNE